MQHYLSMDGVTIERFDDGSAEFVITVETDQPLVTDDGISVKFDADEVKNMLAFLVETA